MCLCYDQGKMDSAASMIEKAILTNPSYAEAYNNLGMFAGFSFKHFKKFIISYLHGTLDILVFYVLLQQTNSTLLEYSETVANILPFHCNTVFLPGLAKFSAVFCSYFFEAGMVL